MKETKASKKFVILATVLLIVAVITLGVTIYLNCITSDTEPSNQTNIAKWGFTITADADNMFSDEHQDTKVDATEESVAVVVNGNAETLAPDTRGNMTVTVRGSAEVLTKLTITAKGTDISLTSTKDGSVYNPVKWTVKKNDTILCENVTMEAACTELENQGQDINKDTSVEDKYTISWNWPFEQGADDKDTMLGMIADGYTTDDYIANIILSFEFTISIEQIQEA